MPIRCTTPRQEIDAYVQRKSQLVHSALIRVMQVAGEMCVNEMRSYNGNAYRDRTGNLRSSTGYIIVDNGRIVNADSPVAFAVVNKGSKGSTTGKELAKRLASEYPKDIVLICVAGMEYATYVQAKGYNVTQSAERIAPQLVKQLLISNGFKTK